MLAFTLHATVFSGASFTAGSVNPGAIFFSGTLAHTNDAGGTFAVDASGLLPGASQTGVMILQGAGTVPARYTLSPIGLTDTPVVARPLRRADPEGGRRHRRRR